MTVSKAAASDMYLRLLELRLQRKSYRCIAREEFPGGIVKAGTLNRIVKEPGWLPKDENILRALGVWMERKRADEHTKFIRRKIRKMAKEVEKALEISEKVTGT